MRRISSILLVSLLLFSCSSKENGNPPPSDVASSQGPAAIPSPKAPSADREPAYEEIQAAITYAVGSTPVDKAIILSPVDQGRLYRGSRPITFPVTVPDQIRIRLKAPRKVFDPLSANEQITSFGISALNPGSSVGLAVQRVSDDPESEDVIFEITGIKKLLSDKEHQSAQVVLEVTRSSGEKITFETELRTPPSVIHFEPMSLLEYEKSARPLTKHLRTLRSMNTRLDLVQTVRIVNPTKERYEFTLPLSPTGKIATRVDTATLTQRWCDYTLKQESHEETLSDHFYLLPLTEDLDRTFLSKIDDAIATNSQTIQIEAKSQRVFGVYAQGEPVASLMEQKRPRSAFTTVQAASSCRSRCGGWGEDAGWNLFKASSYWSEQGWPGASHICNKIDMSKVHPDRPYPDEQSLNQCAEFELSNGSAPWDDRRFCWSSPPGNPWGHPSGEHWHVTKTTVPVAVGTQTYPVDLVFEVPSTLTFLRFAPQSDDPDAPSESRPIQGLLSSRTRLAD